MKQYFLELCLCVFKVKKLCKIPNIMSLLCHEHEMINLLYY